MSTPELSHLDLALSACLILLVAAVSIRYSLGLHRQLLLAALRMVLQLSLIGLVLTHLFAAVHPGTMALVVLVMVAAAGIEIDRRQHHRLRGWSGRAIGTMALGGSSLLVCFAALQLVVQADPWWHPRVAIPLLGMLLGNAMNGIALGLDQLTSGAVEGRRAIEGRLLLGLTAREALRPLHRQCLRTALLPITNTMAVTGLVSLPGMMTGQILGGADPDTAVRYQILIIFLIAGSVGIGTLLGIGLGSHRLMDERARLRLDRLRPANRTP